MVQANPPVPSSAPGPAPSGPGPVPPLSRREREKAAHREAILQVAEEVFAMRGFPGATIAEIARKAEFSVGSIYNFFPGKRELGEAVMERICTERVESVRAEALPLAAESPAGLDALMRVWARHHARHGSFVRIGFEYQRSLGRTEPPEKFKRLFGAYEAARTEFFAAGVASGRYRDLPPADLGRVFEGVCRELLFEWSAGAGSGGGEETLFARLRTVVPVVLAR